MKKQRGKLHLSTERVRLLNDASLQDVAGGAVKTALVCSKDGSVGCAASQEGYSCVTCPQQSCFLC